MSDDYTGDVRAGGEPAVRDLGGGLTLTKVSVGPMDNNAYLLRAGSEQLLIDAFDYVGAITGLAFAYGGTTTEDPRTARVDGAIVVGWVEPFDAVGLGRHRSIEGWLAESR